MREYDVKILVMPREPFVHFGLYRSGLDHDRDPRFVPLELSVSADVSIHEEINAPGSILDPLKSSGSVDMITLVVKAK